MYPGLSNYQQGLPDAFGGQVFRGATDFPIPLVRVECCFYWEGAVVLLLRTMAVGETPGCFRENQDRISEIISGWSKA